MESLTDRKPNSKVFHIISGLYTPVCRYTSKILHQHAAKKKLFRKSVINFPTVKGSDPGHLVTDIWSHDISSLDIWSQPFCHQIFGHTDIWSQDKCRVTKCPPPQGLGLDPQNVSNGSIKGKFSTKKYN